jgi:hypothetical protein
MAEDSPDSVLQPLTPADPEVRTEDSLVGLEVVSLRIEFELVPEWSSVVEKIANFHSQRVAVGFQGKDLVVKAAVAPERKAHLMADIGRYWDQFVERRKREGRWQR